MHFPGMHPRAKYKEVVLQSLLSILTFQAQKHLGHSWEAVNGRMKLKYWMSWVSAGQVVYVYCSRRQSQEEAVGHNSLLECWLWPEREISYDHL